MWSSSGSPATPPRHTAGSADPVDWDSLLPLLPESVRLLRQVLEDDAALHRLLEHCGGLTLRIPRRFPSEGHLLRALLPEPVLRRLLGAYGGTCLYIPRCARLARQVRQRELLGAFSRHTAAGTSSNAEVRFLARRHHGPARLAAAQAGGRTAGQGPSGPRRRPSGLIPAPPFQAGRERLRPFPFFCPQAAPCRGMSGRDG